MKKGSPKNIDQTFWAGKKVLVTGHTGFKGSWLSLWLTRIGAEVTGLSLSPDTEPSLFESARICDAIAMHYTADIRDELAVREIVLEARPDIVFHMAAQPLVLPSYQSPLDTFAINIQGTANVLNAIRSCPETRVVLAITTDKVYENLEFGYPFRETDPLGGHDPYSASKAAAEIIISSFRSSFLNSLGVAVASCRAGNVIGGGDWSKNRLIPDAIRAWTSNQPLVVRSPGSTRPWQHVLEPLFGYLLLCEHLWSDPSLAGAYNFGPNSSEACRVIDVLGLAQPIFGIEKAGIVIDSDSFSAHEAQCLSLENSKSTRVLSLRSRWSVGQSVCRTVDWYRRYYQGIDARELCDRDIVDFEKTTCTDIGSGREVSCD